MTDDREAVFEQAHTPTDDERERIEQSNDIAYTVIEVAQNKAPEEFVTLDFRYGIAVALWDAGYRKTRRPVQGEPANAQVDPRKVAHIACDCVPNLGPEHCHLCSERNGKPTAWPDCASRVAVQGEPTDVQVQRVMQVIRDGFLPYEMSWVQLSRVARAALRASSVQGENREEQDR